MSKVDDYYKLHDKLMSMGSGLVFEQRDVSECGPITVCYYDKSLVNADNCTIVANKNIELFIDWLCDVYDYYPKGG